MNNITLRVEPATFVNDAGEKIAYDRYVLTLDDHDFVVKFQKVDKNLIKYLIQKEI